MNAVAPVVALVVLAVDLVALAASAAIGPTWWLAGRDPATRRAGQVLCAMLTVLLVASVWWTGTELAVCEVDEDADGDSLCGIYLFVWFTPTAGLAAITLTSVVVGLVRSRRAAQPARGTCSGPRVSTARNCSGDTDRENSHPW